MKGRCLLIVLVLFLTTNSSAQCAVGEVELIINTFGGSYSSEKWVNITTGINGTGTVVWSQGSGTIGNASGFLSNETICVTSGVTYYFNAYDEYGDSWDGSEYTVETCTGMVISEVDPDNSDGISDVGWGDGTELESSQMFVANTPIITNDFCEDDAVEDLCAPASYSSTSGKAGIAIILVTDDNPADLTFELYDFDGSLMSDETALGALSANSVYVIYDNPCYDVLTTAGIPSDLDLHDSFGDGIYDNTASLSGGGVYVYYYAADAIENITNDIDGDGKNYITPGTGGFPSFYTAATNKRTSPPSHTNTLSNVFFPPSTSHEYVSAGVWSGTGVTNNGTTTKTYFSGLAGLERTVIFNSGPGQFDPTVPGVGENNDIVYSYYDVYGSAGPAACSSTAITTTSVDVHAKPTITPVLDQVCSAATYDVTLNIDLGTYNVSVDEDGVTPFVITGTGGTISTASLSGTGVQQVTITGIPSGNTWSLDVADASGISCGILGTTGDCITVLPIQLVKFDAYENNRGTINVDWQTKSESNNDYFTVESSLDAMDWDEVKNVDGAGNSSRPIDYRIIDAKPSGNIIYYRLKQTDFNGDYSYSEVDLVSFDDSEFSVYPNPTNDYINMIGNRFELKDVKIYNLLGQDITHDIMIEQISNGYKMSVNDLTAGVYYIKTTTFATSFVKK